MAAALAERDDRIAKLEAEVRQLKEIAHDRPGSHGRTSPSFRRHAPGDRRDHARSHLELDVAIGDAVAPRDPVEVGVGDPDLAVRSHTRAGAQASRGQPTRWR